MSVTDTAPRSETWSVRAMTPWVVAPAVTVAALLVAFAGRYGFHRDELYFIESMRHPAWGYVDNGPLTPAIGWLSRQIFGDSVAGLRVLPALQLGVLVVVVAAIARELGAVPRAQLLAAWITATSSTFLVIGHLLTTPTFDVLATALILLGLIRIVRTGEQRWWLAVGAVVGLGLQNKYTLALTLAALAVAALVTGNWRRLWSGWAVAGAAIAVAIWAPQLWWQIDHGWPQLEFARAIAEEDGVENRLMLVPFQFLILGPPLAPVVIGGLWALWRRPSWHSVRFLALGDVVLLGVLMVSGGKGYYSAGMFAAIIAAGAVATDDWMDRDDGNGRKVTVAVVLVLNFIGGALVALPILPEREAGGPTSALNEDALETIGWPSVVEQVAAAVPAEDRDDVVIVASNYGIAGAIDRFGATFGLPPANSPHNSYVDFRQPTGTDGPVLVIGGDAQLEVWFTGCEQIATIDSPHGIENDVDGTPIWHCDGPVDPWDQLWPKMRRAG